jgi:hypothetical protein
MVTLSSTLEEIDEELRRKGIPISYRPIHAMGLAAQRLDTDYQTIEARVLDWFSSAYGPQVESNFRLLGRMPIILRQELYVMSIIPRITPQPLPEFDWSLNAGPQLLKSLSGEEKAHIEDKLQLGWTCFSELAPLFCDRALPTETTVDLDTSLDQLIRQDGLAYGLSKWASLQAAEKTLKAFLRSRDEDNTPPFTHDIERLHRLAVDQGMLDLSDYRLPEGRLLSLIACTARVRYGEDVVTKDEALSAHYAALILITGVAIKMRVDAGKRNWLDFPHKPTKRFLFRLRRMCEVGEIPHSVHEDQSDD